MQGTLTVDRERREPQTGWGICVREDRFSPGVVVADLSPNLQGPAGLYSVIRPNASNPSRLYTLTPSADAWRIAVR